MTERDERGRFVRGNRASPGRPSRRTETAYLNATAQQVSMSQWHEVVGRALEDARDGDPQARRWLADYLIGRPSTPPLVAGVDTALIERFVEGLRAAGHEPEQFFLGMVYHLEGKEEMRWNERPDTRR
jgi:hypothetical protein